MTKARAAALVPRVLAVLGIAAAMPARAPLSAQTACRAPTGAVATRTAEQDARIAAQGPLARTISLQAGEVTLRAALDLVAEAAKVRLSYSGDLLPLNSRVCATLESTTVAVALAHLLGDAPVQPVVAGDDHVVLAPARTASVARAPSPTPSEPVYQLEEIVAESSVTGAASRGDPVARAVVSGRELEARGVETLAGALRTVPGVWTWGGSDATTRFGSLRGASSFGVSAPKVYIDGIEAASPLLVSRLLPGTVERIEVIRGPQGAGLYGADAIGGVVNVVMRHGSGGPTLPRARIQTLLGSSSSLFSPEVGVSQDHSLSLRTGTKWRNASLDIGLGTAGDHVPGAASRHVSAVGSARWVGGRGLLGATARFSAEGSRTPPSPLLGGFSPVPASASSEEQSLQQYTIGLTGSLGAGRWTHSATAGVDGYALDGASGLGGPLSSAADSALRAASGTASRSTLRLTSVGRFDLGTDDEASVTVTAERSALAQRTVQTTPGGIVGGPGPVPVASLDELSSSRTGYGLGARADASWGSRVFVSSGVRLERTDAVVGLGNMVALPMLGVAAVEELGPLTLKLRGAFGRGIRWPQLAPLPGVPASVMSEAQFVGLAPEVQSGVEGGLDVTLGDIASLHVTRFDQTARGLLQRVTVASDGSGRGGPGRSSYGYRFQNVGEIGNRGWELQGSVSQGPLSVGASLSLVDSRVLRLADGYTGDLRAGDRALEVPARTLGLTASWNSDGWLASLTASRASDWINYDRLALARDLASASAAPGVFVGERLRSYWRPYDGVTHLSATLSRDLFRRFTLTVAGDNLLGHQLGEPDNITVLPGRTLRIGVRASF